jgi:FKBP-type peptidyl-prolyl cis-trans isomerase 2
MAQAKQGDNVRVHYTGTFTDGTIFDSSVQREPLQFILGAGQLIPGFEQAVIGMQPGEARTVIIVADDAYGPRKDTLVFMVDRNVMPAHVNPAVGQRFQIRQRDGATMVVMVTAVSESNITLDANHPLAGKDLTFEIQLLEIL